MRIGAKKRPFYRVVVVDERNKRNGAYIENVGTYDPMTTPHEIKLKQDRIDEWTKKGAQLSDGFLRIIGKAAKRPERKPKKEKAAPKEAVAPKPAAEPTEAPVDATTEEVVTETSPAEVVETPIETEAPTVEEAPVSEESTPGTEEIATEPEAPRNDETTDKTE